MTTGGLAVAKDPVELLLMSTRLALPASPFRTPLR